MKWINRFLIAFSLVFSIFFFKNYSTNQVFYGDALGYYIYLPATFIYDNVTNLDSSWKQKPMPEIMKGYIDRGSYDNPKTPLGKSVIQYTIGIAIYEAPAFFMAQLYCKIFTINDDGFGKPYENAIRYLNWLYTLLGLVLLYYSLINYFNKDISLLTTLLTFIATNLFYFSIYQNGMAHIPMFFSYALLIYFSIRLYKKNDVISYTVIGLLLGLMFISRPSDVVAVFIPLFINLTNVAECKTRLKTILQNWKLWLLAVAASSIPIIMQMMYWKAVSGSYIYYSYGNQKFDFLHPHIINGLLYPSNGWLQYTPFMVFAIFGFLFFKINKAFGLITPVIFLIYSYIIYSWFCYQYINGFGSRPMIHLYPLLAFAIASFYTFVSNQKMVFKTILAIFIGLFIYANLFLSMKQVSGKLWSEFSSFLFNVQSLCNYNLSYNNLVELDIEAIQPNASELIIHKKLGENNFNDSVLSLNIIKADSFNKYYTIHQGTSYSPIFIQLDYNPTDFVDADYVKVSARCMSAITLPTLYWASNLVFQIERDGKQIFYKACKIENKLGVKKLIANHESITVFNFVTNNWDMIEFYIPYPTHKKLLPKDKIRIFISTQPSTTLYIDDVKLELCSYKK